MEKERTTDTVLNDLKEVVESGKMVSPEVWLTAAFTLNLLEIDENMLRNKMRQDVAKSKLAIYKAQEKKNVAAAEMEIEATDAYRMLRDQEDKIDSVKEFIMIAKKNSDY